MKFSHKIKKLTVIGIFGFTLIVLALSLFGPSSFIQAAEEPGSVGLQGKISAEPPKTAPTITLPRDGTTVTTVPVNVTGLCTSGLLVKLFKNNVFAGSTQCANGSYSLQIDLFNGRNELVARQYDDLDQASPDSNMVVVNFPFTGPISPNRISLMTAFAKRGANPGQTLTWPLTLTGGNGPYAVTVDWGDGKQADIISLALPGNFNISHVYDRPGVYNVVIRATDKDKNLAFLQLVGIANGAVGQNNPGGSDGGAATTITQTRILWQPAAIAIPLLISTFWLGKRYELYILRKRLEQSEDIS